MRRTVRRTCVALLALLAVSPTQTGAQPLALLDVPFISQSEALCGGAAAAMVLRFWGATGLTAESFAPLLNRAATGIETNVLVADVQRRGFAAAAVKGDQAFVRQQLDRGRPVITLIEDRPGTFHYLVIVAWQERSVIAHDPARAPFQVIASADFERRWSRSDRWTLVITPAAGTTPTVPSDDRSRVAVASGTASATCEQLVADGIHAAQANHLEAAEESLTRAIGCPGSAPARELAGVRLMQRRWPEVRLLASEAVKADPSDTYAWKLLGTARFVSDETTTALLAWNRAGEPRVDTVRVDGLRRTRQRVIERLIDVKAGELLTAAAWLRAQRQLDELPASSRSSVAYTPTGGAVQVRASIVERAVAPRGATALAGIALNAAINRQVDVSASSLTGGGERLGLSYRFWPHRPRYALELLSPAPWGGVWGVTGAYEEQAFTSDRSISRRETAELGWSRWLAATLRGELSGGVDRWNTNDPLGAVGARADFRSPLGRLAANVTVHGWFGKRSFSTWDGAVTVTNSIAHRGFVALGRASIAGVSHTAPLELWSAGDTGHVRSTLLRAHPLLDDGRFRSERLGRMLVSSSVEGQRWWVEGPISIAATVFVDAGRTLLRRSASDLADIDVGIGARLATPLFPGVIRVDVAKGIRDGHTAVSVVIVR